MKKSRRLLSIILAGSVLLSSNVAEIEPTGEMIRNFSDDISGEYETFLPQPVRYPTHESIDISEYDDYFDEIRSRAVISTEPVQGTTLLQHARQYAEANCLNNNLQASETAAIQQQTAAAFTLSCILPVEETAWSDAASNQTTTASIELTEAEEDFLYFFPVDIRVLRSAVLTEYGEVSDEAYNDLFLKASLQSSSGSDEEPEIQYVDTTSHSDFFTVNSDHESVDTRTGELVYTYNLASVEGKGTLDLNLNLVYRSFSSRLSCIAYSLEGKGMACHPVAYESPMQLHDSSYAIANGWTLDLPYYNALNTSLYIPEYGYFEYIPDGMTKPATGYLYPNNIEVDCNVIKLDDGTKYYFDRSKGYVHQIEDRYGNTICFIYDRSDYSWHKLTSIVDSAGRTFSFSYGDNGSITFTTPDDMEISLQTTASNNDTSLDSISYEYNSETLQWQFTYEQRAMQYDCFSQTPSNTTDRKNYLLSTVESPRGETTSYTYETAAVDMKSKIAPASYTVDRLVTRKSSFSTQNNYNLFHYVYDGTFTGYPNEDFGEDGDTYEYGTYVYNGSTLINYYKHTFFNDSDPTELYPERKEKTTTQKYNYAPDSRYSIESYVTDKNTGLLLCTSNVFQANSGSSDTIGNDVAYTYDGFHITEYNDARGNSTDEEYKIRITYDEDYKQPLTITSYADANTAVRVENTLTTDKKGIAVSKTFVNNVLKEKYEYTYDTYGNITQRKAYTDVTEGSESCIITNYGYSDTVFGRNLLDGVYLTSKTVTDVKDADGTFINEDGNVTITNKFDIMGRVIEQTDPRGTTVTYGYNSVGTLTSVTTPAGTETHTIYYSLNADWVNPVERDLYIHAHDPFGNCTGYFRYADGGYDSYTDVTYIYNNYGAVLAEYNASGEAGYYRKEYVYDGYNLPTSMTLYGNDDVVQSITEYTVERRPYLSSDPNLKAIFYTTELYDGNGTVLVSKKTEAYNMYGEKISETIAPSVSHNGVTVTDDAYTSLHYEYDKNGNLTRTFYVTPGDTDNTAEQRTLETRTYDYAGRLIQITDAVGNSAQMSYDALGRKISETDYKGNTVYYTYDASGNVIRQDSPFDGDTRSVRKWYYDACGNLIKDMQTNHPVGSETTTWNVREYVYDAMNRLTDTVVHVGVDNDGNPIKNYTHYTYNGAGDVTEMYTGLSQPYADTLPSSAYSKTSYTYDGKGYVTSITDALDNTETFTYSRNNMLTRHTDRKGQSFYYTYDALGNVLTEQISSQPGYPKTHFYDAAGRLTGLYEGSSSEAVNYSYDTAGRMTGETNGESITKSYTYDLFGNRTGMSISNLPYYENFISQSYTYDALNRLTGVTAGMQTTSYAYDANGNLLTETTDGLVTSYQYNDANLVTLLTHSVNGEDTETVSRGNLTNYFSYSYNTDGNICSVHEPIYPRWVDYTYDGAGRLIRESQSAPGHDTDYRYEYDASGNRLKKTVTLIETYENDRETVTVTSNTYDKNNRLLTSSVGDTVTAFTYDANGNLLTEGNKTYTYDARNRLTSFTQDGVTTSYTYWQDGLRRTKQQAGADGEEYLWDNGNLVYRHSSGNSITGYAAYYGLGIISGSDWSTGKEYLYRRNAHGDVVMLAEKTESTYQLRNLYEYDAFGTPENYSSTDPNSFLYAGQLYDRESDSYYLRARNYLPGYGRFATEDPIRDGLNWYAYCDNNPVNYYDPSGLIVTEWDTNHLSENELLEIAQATIQYEEARVSGDKIGMNIAHDKAVKIREPHLNIFETVNMDGTVVENITLIDVAAMLLVPVSFLAGCSASDRNAWVNNNIAWKSGVYTTNAPKHLIIDDLQLGHKFGKHGCEYPNITSHFGYRALAVDIFNKPDSIIYDAENGEYYYIRDNDLLRVKTDGTFVSLYPGANSPRVNNAKSR